MATTLTYRCPFCDQEARVGRPCPGCNRQKSKVQSKTVRKKRSWEQEPTGDGLDLPDDDFDYDEFVAREFGKAPHRKLGLAWYWWLLALLLLVGMMAGIFNLGPL